MMKKINILNLTRLLYVLMLLLGVLLFAGCVSTKKAKSTQEKSVSELHENKIDSETKIKFEQSLLRIRDDKRINFKPIDPLQPSKAIYRGDTLSWKNAEIEITETNEEENISSNSETVKNTSDRSTSSKKSEEKKTNKEVDRSSTSPVLIIGLILAALVIGVVVYLKKSTPFL